MKSELKTTPFNDLHIENGATMMAFAGYNMPLNYTFGILKEHQHTRTQAGLFDISHMGQVLIRSQSWSALAQQFEKLVPQDVLNLADGRQRYGFLTTDTGGILDDIIFARRKETLFVVINAANKTVVIRHLRDQLQPACCVSECKDRALIALQGPKAEFELSKMNQKVVGMQFMDNRSVELNGMPVWISRSGYTGEDGYEISMPLDVSQSLVRALIARESVQLIGLGARDSLRLEAGFCLHGHDIDVDISPVEASLSWAIPKVRRKNGERGGAFRGESIILGQLINGVSRQRVGLMPNGRSLMRAGVTLYANEKDCHSVGRITSGGFGPTIEKPVAMGMVNTAYAKPGTGLFGDVRGKRLPVTVATLPFVVANIKRDQNQRIRS
ncbi:MAG: glycine cleavage system aminomethyltransferase GcvT [Aestuariivita sp.]|nr:glycine cleavage system aminomethyltransferase GcvT [Aestuariivita sp.]